jgi:hypothetical protein
MLEAIEEENTLSPDLFVQKSNIYVEFQILFGEQELQWVQRSHEKWLLCGEQNTNYFHNLSTSGVSCS